VKRNMKYFLTGHTATRNLNKFLTLVNTRTNKRRKGASLFNLIHSRLIQKKKKKIFEASIIIRLR
jgi:hypothetical protein